MHMLLLTSQQSRHFSMLLFHKKKIVSFRWQSMSYFGIEGKLAIVFFFFLWEHSLFPPVICHDLSQTRHTNWALHTPLQPMHRQVRNGSLPPRVTEWHQSCFGLQWPMHWGERSYWAFTLWLWVYVCFSKDWKQAAWEVCVIYHQQGLASTVHLCDTYRKCLKWACCFM